MERIRNEVMKLIKKEGSKYMAKMIQTAMRANPVKI
jgi:hypothetical protein